MQVQFWYRSLPLLLAMLWALTTPTVGQAGEDVLFQLARSTLNEQAGPSMFSLSFRQSQCLEALAFLKREKETADLLMHWPADSPAEAESRLATCWEHGLYQAGLKYAPKSGLSLSRKLTSLAGHAEVPPEKVIAQLLAQEQQPVAPQDQSMVALLEFAARYDQALQGKNPKVELSKLVPEVNQLTPQALRLLEKQYPSENYYVITWHPVRAEVAQCALAMLTIVPQTQRSRELHKLSSQIDQKFARDCYRRGWYAAFETGIELLAQQSESMARSVWQSRFLADPEILTSNSIFFSADRQIAYPELSRFITGLKSFLELLNTQAYQQNPADLDALLKHEDSELWRLCVLLSLETARLRKDRELLTRASNSLLQQSKRLLPSTSHDFQNRIRDLNCLYYSAFQAARSVDDQKLQQELLTRVLALYPRIDVGWFETLNERHVPKVEWIYLVSDPDLAPGWLQKYESMLLEDFEKTGGAPVEIGALWATTGRTTIGGKSLLPLLQDHVDLRDVARGAGDSAGGGRAALPVKGTWLRLCQLNPHFDNVPCFLEFCEGFMQARQSQKNDWDARFLRVLEECK
jgi:hypothetical protein